MRIHHIAVVCASEENADRFYQRLLGLERIRSYPVSAELSNGLFGFERGFQACNYVKGNMNVEVFVIEKSAVAPPNFHHVALEVDNLEEFLKRCKEMKVQILQVPKGDKIITMIKDFDGNIFEIKETA
jgi:catechol 2,3-dioxygenase-like lactoylglutathione lyase family enzyme